MSLFRVSREGRTFVRVSSCSRWLDERVVVRPLFPFGAVQMQEKWEIIIVAGRNNAATLTLRRCSAKFPRCPSFNKCRFAYARISGNVNLLKLALLGSSSVVVDKENSKHRRCKEQVFLRSSRAQLRTLMTCRWKQTQSRNRKKMQTLVELRCFETFAPVVVRRKRFGTSCSAVDSVETRLKLRSSVRPATRNKFADKK